MTKRNKVILGVVVVLGGLYLFDRNRKMKEKQQLVAGADVTPAPAPAPVSAPTIVKATASLDAQKELNFAGSNKNEISAQYFR